MATEDFTLVQLRDKTIYYLIHDLEDETVWDQSDNVFKDITIAVDPYIPTTQKTILGASGYATYTAPINLTSVHNGALKSFYFAAHFRDGAAPDEDTDRPAGYLTVEIEKGVSRFSEQQLDGSPSGGGCIGIGSEHVDQDYGGSDNLSYCLSGVPVDNADILIYLYNDYIIGNRSQKYVKAVSKATVTGAWVQAVMLDPAVYAVQFNKQGVAGPDAWRLVVSLDSNLIDVSLIPREL
jgi:hypothetical protein